MSGCFASPKPRIASSGNHEHVDHLSLSLQNMSTLLSTIALYCRPLILKEDRCERISCELGDTEGDHSLFRCALLNRRAFLFLVRPCVLEQLNGPISTSFSTLCIDTSEMNASSRPKPSRASPLSDTWVLRRALNVRPVGLRIGRPRDIIQRSAFTPQMEAFNGPLGQSTA